MADIQTSSFSETASSNNAAPPDGMPEGQSSASVNDGVREVMGAIKREYNRSHPTQTSTGTGTAYLTALTVSPPAYTQGLTFAFRAHAVNTAGATMAPGSLAAKTIMENGSAGLVNVLAGSIQIGQLVVVAYDTTADALVMVAPPRPSIVNLGSTPLATLTTSAGITIPTGYRSLRIGISPTIGGAAGNQTMSLQVMINGAWLTATAGYYAGQQVDWSNAAGFTGTNMVDTPSGIVLASVNNSTAAAATLTLELDDVRAVARTNHLIGSAGYNNLTNWVTRQIFGLITTPSNQRIEAVRVANVTGGASAFATGYLHVEGVPA